MELAEQINDGTLNICDDNNRRSQLYKELILTGHRDFVNVSELTQIHNLFAAIKSPVLTSEVNINLDVNKYNAVL